jgi:hypothetical protein
VLQSRTIRGAEDIAFGNAVALHATHLLSDAFDADKQQC